MKTKIILCTLAIVSLLNIIFTGCKKETPQNKENENKTPTCSITSPVANAAFATTETITVTVVASDADGSISKVTLFVDNTAFGTPITTSPYTFTIPAGTLATGSHSIKAIATDNSNATAEATVSIAVNNIPINNIPKLYVCGTVWQPSLGKQQATVWINGIAAVLSGNDESFAQGMVVTDAGDIYVAGATKVTQWRATYWKNGSPVYLTDGTKEAGISSIFVNGTDVYACGGERNEAGVFVAKYWKNGAAALLTDGIQESAGNSIAVSGNNVYVVGYEISPTGIKEAKLWKNGIATTLETNCFATSIVVSGTEVHIVGGYFGSYIGGWHYKNSSIINLGNGHPLNKVFVSGNDVYIAGIDNRNSAGYWKNETWVSLQSIGCSASSIFVSGSDVYVAGKSSLDRPIYWKNEQKFDLSPGGDWHNNATDIVYK